MYPIIRVTQPPDAPEQLGTKKKYWYEDDDGCAMLFKAEERGYGEDWSEKVVCELAGILGLPHVHYDLARDVTADEPGVVSAQMLIPGETLVHGNTLLQAIDPDYPKKMMRVSDHTVDAVYRAVWMLHLPEQRWCANLPTEMRRGIDVFCGYLMLDAWVANQDRHHENWAAVWTENRLTLAPSYDHGSALARNVGDQEKKARLRTNDVGYSVAAFARRASSRLFDAAGDPKPLGALDAFQALSARVPEAAQAWKDRLRTVDENIAADVLEQVPPQRLSAISREFTLQLLLENRSRILA